MHLGMQVLYRVAVGLAAQDAACRDLWTGPRTFELLRKDAATLQVCARSASGVLTRLLDLIPELTLLPAAPDLHVVLARGLSTTVSDMMMAECVGRGSLVQVHPFVLECCSFFTRLMTLWHLDDLVVATVIQAMNALGACFPHEFCPERAFLKSALRGLEASLFTLTPDSVPPRAHVLAEFLGAIDVWSERDLGMALFTVDMWMSQLLDSQRNEPVAALRARYSLVENLRI